MKITTNPSSNLSKLTISIISLKMKYLYLILLLVGANFSFSQDLGEDCMSAIELQNDTLVYDTMMLNNISISLNCDYAIPKYSRGKWYKYVGDGRLISVLLENTFIYSNKLSIYVGNCDSLICDYTLQNKILTKVGKTYYFLVESSSITNINSSPFTLSFSSKTVVPSALCSTAPLIACGDSLNLDFKNNLLPSTIQSCQTYGNTAFIKILGDGNKRVLHFKNANLNQFYILNTQNADCENVICNGILYVTPRMEFSTKPDVTYLLMIVDYQNNSANQITLSMECAIDTVTSTCEKAIDLHCGDKNTSVPNSESIPEFGENGAYQTWHKLVGDDNQYQFDFGSQPIFNIGNVRIFRSSSECNNLELVIEREPAETINQISFNAIQGYNYYFQIMHYGLSEIQFDVKCSALLINNISCNTAQAIDCNATYDLIRNTIPKNEICKDTSQGGQWFIIDDSKPNYEFALAFADQEVIDMTIFEGECDSLSCLLNKQFYAQNSIDKKVVINVPENKLYYVRFINHTFKSVQLSVNCPSNSELTSSVCEAATIVGCGEPVESNNLDYGIDFLDPCNYSSSLWYKVIGDDKIITFPTIEYGSHELSLYLGECRTLNCLTQDNRFIDNFRFFAIKDSTYYIKVRTDFRSNQFPPLELKCIPAETNWNCSNAKPINCSVENLELNFRGSGMDYQSKATCPISNLQGLWYYIEGDGNLYSIKNTTDNMIFMSLYEGDCSTDLSCKIIGGVQLKFKTLVGVRYMIHLVSPSDQTSFVTINCTEDESDNEIPDKANIISCGEFFDAKFDKADIDSTLETYSLTSLWFKVRGDNRPITISKEDSLPLYFLYEVYEGDTSRPIIKYPIPVLQFYNDSKIEFFGKQNVDYYIRLITDDNKNHRFGVQCRPAEIGDICENAITIECGKSYVYNSNNYTDDYFDIYTFYKGMWFTFDGNDQYFDIILDQFSINNSRLYEMDITSGDCKNLILSTSPYAATGKKYFFNIGNLGLNSTVNNIKFSVVCRDASNNASQCKDAKPLSCGDSFVTNNHKWDASAFAECTLPERGDWYSFQGDGSTWSFFKNSNHLNAPLVYLGIGNCDSLICVNGFGRTTASQLGDLRNGFSIKTIIGKQYLLKFVSENGDRFEYEYSIECFTESNNYSCTNAQEIICGSTFSGSLSNALVDQANICNDLKPGTYFKFKGNGDDLALQLKNKIGRNLMIKVMENDCVNGRCLYESEIYNSGDALVIQTINNRNYFIKVTSDIPDDVFSFKTSCLEKNSNFDCNRAEFINCGDSVDVTCYTPVGIGTSIPCFGGQNSYNWFILPKTDSLFNVQINNNTYPTYNIELLSGNCNQLQCLASFTNLNSEINFKVNSKDDNYIVVHSPTNSINEMNVKLNCLLSPVNDVCDGALPIQCGDQKSGSTSLSRYFPNRGRSMYYSINGTNRKITINVSGLQRSTSIVIAEHINCNDMKNILDENLYNEGQLEFVGIEGKTYILIISNYDYAGSNFDVNMSCSEPVINDLCDGAIELSPSFSIDLTNSTGHFYNNLYPCQQKTNLSIWYKTDGNDSIHIISTPQIYNDYIYYQLFSGQCNELSCIESGQIYDNKPIKFYSESGKKYFISFYTETKWQVGPFKMYYSIIASPPNDFCNSAVILECGDSISIDLDAFSKDGIQVCNGNQPSSWYKFKGQINQQLNLTFENPPTYAICEIFENCVGNCIGNFPIISNSINTNNFLTLEDKEYLIRVIPTYDGDTNHIVCKVSCSEFTYPNLVKDGAIPLDCDQYLIETSLIAKSFDNPIFNNISRQLWYSFTGDGSILSVKTDLSYSDGYFVITDSLGNEIHNLYFNGGNFQTLVDQKYFMVLLLYRNEFQSNVNFEIEYECENSTADHSNSNYNITATPNPFSYNTTLNYTSDVYEVAKLKIVDIDGRIVVQRDVIIHQGSNIIELSGSEITATGVYGVTIFSKEKNRYGRLLKVK